MKLYIAGPMTGLPQFNVPLFDAVTKLLRDQGHEVISPAELDSKDVRTEALASSDGKLDPGQKIAGETWGDMLARDVKVIADDGVTHVVVLPGWTKSRGARLEAFVACLCGLEFFEWDTATEMPLPRPTAWAKAQIAMAWSDEVVMYTPAYNRP